MTETFDSKMRGKMPAGKKRWFGILMKNGMFHVKEYLGPSNFHYSTVFNMYNDSPYVERIIAPIMLDRKDDHKAILRRMLNETADT